MSKSDTVYPSMDQIKLWKTTFKTDHTIVNFSKVFFHKFVLGPFLNTPICSSSHMLNKYYEIWSPKQSSFEALFLASWFSGFLWQTLWPLFMDRVQLSQGCRVTTSFWYSFDRPRKDQRLIQPWSQPVISNLGPLHWESSALTTRTRLFLHILFNTQTTQPFLCLETNSVLWPSSSE